MLEEGSVSVKVAIVILTCHSTSTRVPSVVKTVMIGVADGSSDPDEGSVCVRLQWSKAFME